MTRPYSIALLNDLHEHFPDLLYRPQRFTNVSDVLNYVIQIARQNPYEQARTRYETDHPPAPPLPARTQPSTYRMSREPNPRIRINARAPPTEPNFSQILNGFNLPGHVDSLVSVSYSEEPSVSQLIQQLFSGTSSLESFLEPVTVRPTESQIRQGSRIFSAYQGLEVTCAICQAACEEGQMVRQLNFCSHNFHQSCVDTWFEQHVTCPICRHDIRDQQSFD
jgi:hypothetical protein